MLRRLFDVMVALSLLLCVAVGVLWGRSYWLSDRLESRGVGGLRWVQSAQGHVFVGLALADCSGHPAAFYRWKYIRDSAFSPLNDLIFLNPDRGDIDISRECGGFAWYEKRKARRRVVHVRVVVPFWSILVTMVLPPIGWAMLRGRAHLRGQECHRIVPDGGG